MLRDDDQSLVIERVRVLQGHTDPDSAYVVDDYPYGRTLRCTIRYWIETAVKGKAKGQQRFVRQTTNPKVDGQPWNEPHYSTYTVLAVLYLDEQDHVQWWGTGIWMRAVGDAWARLMGIVDQLTWEQGRLYDVLLAASKRADARWGDFDEAVTALAAEIAYSGQLPTIENGVWELPNGWRLHFGSYPTDWATYVTAARQRVAEQRKGTVGHGGG